MSDYEFPVAGPITAAVQVRAGEVEIIAEARDTVTVSVKPSRGKAFAVPRDPSQVMVDNARVEMVGNTLVVETGSGVVFGFMSRTPAVHVVIRMPLDGIAEVKTGSADVRLSGAVSAATLQSGSGDVVADNVTGALTLKTASGDARINRVGGDAHVSTASGDVSIQAIGGNLQLNSASGACVIGPIAGSAAVSTASGDIRLESLRGGDYNINSVSGDVAVSIARGTSVWFDVSSVSGDTRSELEASTAPADGEPARLKLRVRTVSGDVRLLRAAPAEPAADAATAATDN